MREMPPVDVEARDLEEAARPLAEAAVKLREDSYVPRNRFIDVEGTADTPEELFDKARVTGRIKASYRGLGEYGSVETGLANPESDDPFENFSVDEKHAYREAMRKGKLWDSASVNIPGIEFPHREKHEQILGEAKDALEDQGYDFMTYRINGGTSQAASAFEAVEALEDYGAELQMFVEEPRDEESVLYSTHIVYTDNGEDGFFWVHSTPFDGANVSEGAMDDWDREIASTLEGPGFPATVRSWHEILEEAEGKRQY